MDVHLENTFLEALEQYQHKLLRICSVYALNADDKKDLFQEAVINIWQAMPTFQDRSRLSTWMFRITLNVCLRLQSKEARKNNRFRRLDSFTVESLGAEEINPEEEERLNLLRSCIQQLHEVDKAITTLYLEEMSYKEMAEITGLTENHIAVKMKRIKTKLLNCINQKL